MNLLRVIEERADLDLQDNSKVQPYKIIQDIPETIFRAYDIRGIVDKNLTPDIVYTIGLAIGAEAKARGENFVAVGRDGRHSSPELSKALQYGLTQAGVTTIDLLQVPTPVLYLFLHQNEKITSGVMVTGSHNPSQYNGLKIVLGQKTLFGDAISALRERILAGISALNADEPTGFTPDALEAYQSFICQNIKIARPLNIVIDSGNGVTGAIAPALFRQLGCEVHELFCEVDGDFPNHHPDPSRPENLRDLIAKVEETGANLGLAFDGDGDRLGVVTAKGKIIWPDRQMMLFSQDILSRNPGASIIYDVKCSRHLAEVIETAGGRPMMWKTGHSYIKSKMLETGALLAGEMSGHIFFKERWFGFDDAMYAGVRLLEIVSHDNRSVDEIFSALPDSLATPELQLAITDERKFIFMDKLAKTADFSDAKICTIDGVRVDFPDAWGLVRASNTTPSIVFRFEADDEVALEGVKSKFRHWLHALDPDLQLPF
jgi:phosphomannomutase/phosphoglucomutase